MSMSSLSSLDSGDDLSDTEDTIPANFTKAPSPPKEVKPKPTELDKYDDEEFRRLFRVNKDTVLHVAELINDSIKTYHKKRAVQPLDQILITLRYFATACYHKFIGTQFNVRQCTVHRVMHRVADALAKLKDTHITMPTQQEQWDVANEFYQIAGIPHITGVVGCTHVKVMSPGRKDGGQIAKAFKFGHRFFSINVQMVADARLKIRNIVARPGSTPDSNIFAESELCAELERGDYGNVFLLGDGRYPCRHYLLTPVQLPTTPADEHYNQAHMRSYGPVIDGMFSLLHRRFPCLHKGLGVKTEKVPAIITACAVLHNIAMERNDILEEEVTDTDLAPPRIAYEHNMEPEPADAINFNVRDFIINNHFSYYKLFN